MTGTVQWEQETSDEGCTDGAAMTSGKTSVCKKIDVLPQRGDDEGRLPHVQQAMAHKAGREKSTLGIEVEEPK